MSTQPKPSHYCSFCGKSNFEVLQIVAASGACICNECVLKCVETIFENNFIDSNKPSTEETQCNNPPA